MWMDLKEFLELRYVLGARLWLCSWDLPLQKPDCDQLGAIICQGRHIPITLMLLWPLQASLKYGRVCSFCCCLPRWSQDVRGFSYFFILYHRIWMVFDWQIMTSFVSRRAVGFQTFVTLKKQKANLQPHFLRSNRFSISFFTVLSHFYWADT